MRELRAAKAEAAAFEAHRYTAHIDADTDRAHRGLQQVDDDAKRTDKNLREASKGGSMLVNSLIALGPAAIPLTAVAATLGVGLVAAAGVGVLAILGIKNALKDAAPLGQVFNQQLSILNKDLHTLETTAARGVFGGLQQGIARLHEQMPALNKDVSQLSVQLGQVVGRSVTGLVALFHQLNPLFLQFGDYLVTGATKFEQWAQSGKGVQGFLAYASDNLPKVGKLLGDLATTLVHITEAGAPLGPVVVQALDDIAVAINKIPIPVLTAFIAALQVNRLLAMAGGVKGLSDAFDSMSGKLGSALTALGGFLQGTAGLGATLGVVGIGMAAVAAGAIALHGHIPVLGVDINDVSSAGDKAKKSFDDVATTLGGQVKDAFATGGAGAQELATKSVLAAAASAQVQGILYATGKTANDFATAITGTNTQYDNFIESVSKSAGLKILPASTLDDLRKLRTEYVNGQIDGKAFADAADAINKALSAPNLPTYAGSLAYLAKQFNLTEVEARKYAGILGITTDAIDNGQLSNKQLADSVHLVQTAFANANITQGLFLDSLQKFSTGTGTAAERAALIGATLVAGNGDALQFASAMNAGAVATANLGTSVGHLAKGVLDLRTGTINYNNAAAAPLIQGLQQMQSSAMAAAEAMFQHEKGLKGGKVAADDAYNAFHHLTYDALVSQASQLGLTTAQAKKLADQYFGMPKDVKTKLEQEGADPVISVLKNMERWLHMIADPTWKPTVSVNDKATIPLSAIDQHLGLVGSRRPHPDVALIDHVSVPLSAVDRHLGLTGSKHPRPDVALVDHASVPLSALDQRLSAVGGRRPTPTAILRDLASNTIRGIDGLLRSIDGRVVTSTIVTQHLDIFTVQDAASNRGPAGVTSRIAKGGILRYYAAGGLDMPDRHQPEIAPKGTMRVWAEPETEGEAYIPYRKDTRDRSRAIWETVGRDLGFLRAYAEGGRSFTTQAPAVMQGGGTDASMWGAVLAALQALLAEMRGLRANSDPWRQAQFTKMHERTR